MEVVQCSLQVVVASLLIGLCMVGCTRAAASVEVSQSCFPLEKMSPEVWHWEGRTGLIFRLNNTLGVFPDNKDLNRPTLTFPSHCQVSMIGMHFTGRGSCKIQVVRRDRFFSLSDDSANADRTRQVFDLQQQILPSCITEGKKLMNGSFPETVPFAPSAENVEVVKIRVITIQTDNDLCPCMVEPNSELAIFTLDIDECASPFHHCPLDQVCVNIIGGFECKDVQSDLTTLVPHAFDSARTSTPGASTTTFSSDITSSASPSPHTAGMSIGIGFLCCVLAIMVIVIVLLVVQNKSLKEQTQNKRTNGGSHGPREHSLRSNISSASHVEDVTASASPGLPPRHAHSSSYEVPQTDQNDGQVYSLPTDPIDELCQVPLHEHGARNGVTPFSTVWSST